MKGRKPDLKNVIPLKGGPAPKAVPAALDFMTDEARRVWDELAPALVAKDRLAPEYRYQFAAYCEQVARFIEAIACVAIEGTYYSVKTRNGLQQKKTAAFSIQLESVGMMNRLSALFGLSPVDEARLGISGQGDLFAAMMDQLRNGTD